MMCLVGKISIMCPFFRREISLLLRVSRGLSRSARTFGYVFISLSVPVSVIQVSACAPHSPLCTPAHPLGALLYVLRRGHDVCVCVAPPLTLVDCSVVTTCVSSQTCVLYKACPAYTDFLKCTHHRSWDAVHPQTPLSQWSWRLTFSSALLKH